MAAILRVHGREGATQPGATCTSLAAKPKPKLLATSFCANGKDLCSHCDNEISQHLMYHLLGWGQKDKLFTFKSTVATHARVSRYTGYWQLHLGDK